MTTPQKGAARKAAFARRKAAHAQGLDGPAQEALLTFLAAHEGKTLAGYIPIRSEINPLPVMAAWTSAVGVPVIQGAHEPLMFHQWSPGCSMKDGPFGAKVPEEERPVIPEVLIVPLVAFDARGFRLGYGGGFYDRTLELLRTRGPVTAIGLAYAAQEADTLPLEPTDQPLDAIATDQGLRTFG